MPSLRPLATPLLLAGILCAPAWAASSASSASSQASSASVGSVSTSFEASSDSSKGGGKVAAGEYRVVNVAAGPRDGTLRLALQAVGEMPADARREFVLVLPAVTAERAALAVGSGVTAREQAYGMQFAAGEPRQPFFLVLHDETHRELQLRPVTL